MAELIRGLQAERVSENVRAVREAVDEAARRAGRDPGAVLILAATKYVAVEEMAVLAEAGVRAVGENRLQDLEAKQALVGERFDWEFIGALQSRKVRRIAPRVRRIHSLAGDSALRALATHAPSDLEVLIEVNVAGEEGKEGVAPAELPAFLERARAVLRVSGLMTMPPHTRWPEDSRRHFAALRELAATHGLAELSMGTTQDHLVAVGEGATIVRVGSRLFSRSSGGGPSPG